MFKIFCKVYDNESTEPAIFHLGVYKEKVEAKRYIINEVAQYSSNIVIGDNIIAAKCDNGVAMVYVFQKLPVYHIRGMEL